MIDCEVKYYRRDSTVSEIAKLTVKIPNIIVENLTRLHRDNMTDVLEAMFDLEKYIAKWLSDAIYNHFIIGGPIELNSLREIRHLDDGSREIIECSNPTWRFEYHETTKMYIIHIAWIVKVTIENFKGWY